MRLFLMAAGLLLALVVAVPLFLLATGTIDTTSVRMMLNVMTGAGGPQAERAVVAERYQVPEGFYVDLYVNDVPRARFLHVTDNGDLLVSRPHEGDILLLRADRNEDGLPDGRVKLLSDLKRPHGLATHRGYLYVAESHRVIKVPFDAASGALSGDYEIIVDDLSDNGNHWSKTLHIGPDNRLYLAQGSTCNVCEEADARRATIMRFNLDGSEGEIYATGLRNSVGFDWAPWSGGLYATDNGRDLLGDDYPPCELNLIEQGGFYGWPYYNGDNDIDPDMGEDPMSGSRAALPPVHAFRAHNAPLGIHFLDASELPAGFERSALVALHGSWNRSEPDGYKVVSLHWTDTGIVERDFLSGFLRAGQISGRPADIAQSADGTIYVSDDYAGAIYRITTKAPAAWRALSATASSRLDPAPPEWLEDADLAAMAGAGEALYRRYGCASCHEAGMNPKRLDNLSDRLGYGAVIDALRAPQSPMPVYPLSETEQRELAVFLLRD